jgi:F-type H+-transporting ATPase subunit b
VTIDVHTVLLEAANFALLVWLLWRFLYRPVLKTVRERRLAIEEEMAKAARRHAEAEALHEAGRRNLEAWEQEQESRLGRLEAQLAQERERGMAELRTELDAEREKARAVEARQREEQQRRIEAEALLQAARFAARLLEALAGPELDQRLARLFLDELARLPAEQAQAIRATLPEDEDLVLKVVSAYPLDASARDGITRHLRAAIGREAPVQFAEDPQLVAGVQVHLGYWQLGASLRDELKFFAEAASHGP